KYPEVSELALLTTVDYEIPNSAITLKFKQLPGITPVSISTTQRNALLAKNYELYVQRGGVSMVEEGKVSSGEYIDIIHGVDWLGDTIAVRVFGELYVESKKVAMTDDLDDFMAFRPWETDSGARRPDPAASSLG
ncbi:MAG: DUF3383 family protein, partial [Planctomycetes bacterium]|nr:DUF3383 family protein [Planctomycetota bacterium]